MHAYAIKGLFLAAGEWWTWVKTPICSSVVRDKRVLLMNNDAHAVVAKGNFSCRAISLIQV